MKFLFSRRLYINFPLSLFLLITASFVYLFAVIYVQPEPFSSSTQWLSNSGLWIYALNWVPIFLCLCAIYFLCNNCALAISITGALCSLLSVANYFKIQFRQAPLWPWDFALGGEVIGISKSFSTLMITKIVCLIFGMLLFIGISVFLIRNKPLSIYIRIIGFAVSLISSLILTRVYAEKPLYDSAYVEGNPYSEVDQYNSRGFVYSFFHAMASTRIEKPPGYDKQFARNFLDNFISPTDLNELKKPHILMVMGEAFSDIALNPELDFSEYTDPLAFYKELKTQSLSGYIVVPNVGGGTADTEFDVLTAINSRNYRGVPYSLNLVTRPVESLASELSKVGYTSLALHPGHGWFYNRISAYPNMGFDRFVHIFDFDDDVPLKGAYVDETSTIDRIIEEFENHKSVSSNPLFEFCITIQNHGPYVDKYVDDVIETPPNFNTTLDFAALQLNALYNYFLGLADADRELGRLTAYLESSPEPVVLVYFGDHLPSFDDDIYRKLLPEGEPGYISGETKLYRVPYLIWQNPAAERMNDKPLLLPANEIISSSYLGAILLRYLGLSDISAYFAFAAQVSDEYPVVFESRYADSSGLFHLGDDPEMLKILRTLEFYRFFSQ